MTVRYERCLSPDFEAALWPGGPLEELLRDYRSWVPDDPAALEVQLREHDELMLYHGITRPLTMSWRSRNGRGEVVFSAHPTYAQLAAPGLMAPHPVEFAATLRNDVRSHVVRAVAGARDSCYRCRKEGYWQNQLGLAWGARWSPEQRWLVVDREVVVGYDDAEERARLQGRAVAPYAALQEQLQGEAPRRWGRPDRRKTFGAELDLLAVGREGELVCIELKHGSNTKGVYWGPLQVGVYRDLVTAALPQVSLGVKALVEQKVRLGLLPRVALDRLPAGDFPRVEAALVVADPNPRSRCWDKLGEVCQRAPGAPVEVVTVSSPAAEPRPAPTGSARRRQRK